jgi:hypothetical protein
MCFVGTGCLTSSYFHYGLHVIIEATEGIALDGWPQITHLVWWYCHDMKTTTSRGFSSNNPTSNVP